MHSKNVLVYGNDHVHIYAPCLWSVLVLYSFWVLLSAIFTIYVYSYTLVEEKMVVHKMKAVLRSCTLGNVRETLSLYQI